MGVTAPRIPFQSLDWEGSINWLGFSLTELRQFMLNSIDAAWVNDDLKAKWSVEWTAEFDRLADKLPKLG